MSLTIGVQRSKLWLESGILTLILSMLVMTPVKIALKVIAVHVFGHVKTICRSKKGKAKKDAKAAERKKAITHIMAEAAPELPRAKAALLVAEGSSKALPPWKQLKSTTQTQMRKAMHIRKRLVGKKVGVQEDETVAAAAVEAAAMMLPPLFQAVRAHDLFGIGLGSTIFVIFRST